MTFSTTRILKAAALAAVVSLSPMVAQALTVTGTASMDVISVTRNGAVQSLPFGDPTDLVAGDQYNFTLETDTTGSFRAEQTFSNIAPNEGVLAGVTLILSTQFENEFVEYSIDGGATFTSLVPSNAGDSFPVAAPSEFILAWGADATAENGTFVATITAVPLPAGAGLLLAGLGGLAMLRRRKIKSA